MKNFRQPFSCLFILMLTLSGQASGDIEPATLLAALPEPAQAKITPAVRSALLRGQRDGFFLILQEPDAALATHTRYDAAARTERRSQIQSNIAISQRVIEARHEHAGLNIEHRYRNLPILKVSLDQIDLLPTLLTETSVVALAEDELLYERLSQSLPLIDQPQASTFGFRGANQTVAVLDTGLNYALNSFGNCSAPGVPTSCRVLHAQDFAPEDNTLDAGTTQHGTYVSAIVANTATQASLVALDVFSGSSALSSDILEAIDWIIEHKDSYQIGVANFSLGGTTSYSSPCNQASNPFRSAFAELVANDILPVVAAGNEGWSNAIASPACLSNAFSVGATYDQTRSWIDWGHCRDEPATVNQVACMSNSASFLDLLAPGAIISTESFSGGGTSMAAPHVSAAAAILRSRFPAETQLQIQDRLHSSAVTIIDPKNGLSFPFLDLSSALNPSNDSFDNTEVLVTDTLTISGNTGFTSVESSEPGGLGNSIWYELTVSAEGWFAPSLISADAGMTVNIYTLNTTGGSFGDLTLIASINAASTELIRLESGLTYQIQIGSPTSGGSFELTLTASAPPEPMIDADIPFLPGWALISAALALLVTGRVKRK